MLDVADEDAVQALFAEIGQIDILVNNAGTNIQGRAFPVLTPADFRRVLDINTSGAFNCTHFAVPGMAERRDGLIINISSIAGCRTYEQSGAACT